MLDTPDSQPGPSKEHPISSEWMRVGLTDLCKVNVSIYILLFGCWRMRNWGEQARVRCLTSVKGLTVQGVGQPGGSPDSLGTKVILGVHSQYSES